MNPGFIGHLCVQHHDLRTHLCLRRFPNNTSVFYHKSKVLASDPAQQNIVFIRNVRILLRPLFNSCLKSPNTAGNFSNLLLSNRLNLSLTSTTDNMKTLVQDGKLMALVVDLPDPPIPDYDSQSSHTKWQAKQRKSLMLYSTRFHKALTEVKNAFNSTGLDLPLGSLNLRIKISKELAIPASVVLILMSQSAALTASLSFHT